MKALWSAKWYIMLGLFSYTLFLLATAPLDFIWRQAQPHLGKLPVQIKQVSGTVWDGQAKLHIPQLGPVAADWQVAAASLLTGTLDLDVNVVGKGLKVKGHANLTQQQIQVSDADVFMSSGHLAPLLRQGRAKLAGDFELNKLNAAFNIQDKQILSAEGRLIFSGGDVSFPVDGKPVNATLPMLVGKLNKPADNVELSLTTTEGDAIGSGYLQPDGWGGVAIKRRFLDILGQKWPKDVDEETVIFEVSQKLL